MTDIPVGRELQSTNSIPYVGHRGFISSAPPGSLFAHVPAMNQAAAAEEEEDDDGRAPSTSDGALEKSETGRTDADADRLHQRLS